MNTAPLSPVFSAIRYAALSCLMLIFTGGFSNAVAQANVPLNGVFATGNWRVRLDPGSGSGTFLSVGSGSRRIGETFLKVIARSSPDTWRGRAFDRTFSAMQESTISIRGDVLTIAPKAGGTYMLTRVRHLTPASAIEPHRPASPREQPHAARTNASGRGGADCDPVQCHATTKAGSRCRRTTRNCNGNCWQH